ncbi:hypothetical protein BJ742DRAFT_765822 [Cladochytrium replicatum]|nr:hypothetical protein BJ742DRAFT_765822 [Cladochytrium replicatum]
MQAAGSFGGGGGGGFAGGGGGGHGGHGRHGGHGHGHGRSHSHNSHHSHYHHDHGHNTGHSGGISFPAGALLGYLLGRNTRATYTPAPAPYYTVPTRAVPVPVDRQPLLAVAVDPVRARKDRLARFCGIGCCFAMISILFVVAITWGSIPKYQSLQLTIVAGDRRLITPDTSKHIEVDFAGSNDVSAYLFDKKPPLSDYVRYPDSTIDMTLKGQSWQLLRYDLFAGSSVAVQYQFTRWSNGLPSFIIIQGEDGFDFFRENGYARHGTKMHEEQGRSGRYDFTAPGDGTDKDPENAIPYYFIFYTFDSRASGTGSATFSVVARTYSLTRPPPTRRCQAYLKNGETSEFDAESSLSTSGICTFPITPRPKPYILLVAPNTGIGSYTVTMNLIPRESALSGIVGIFPTVVIVALVLMCCCCLGCFHGCFVFLLGCLGGGPQASGYSAIPGSDNVPVLHPATGATFPVNQQPPPLPPLPPLPPHPLDPGSQWPHNPGYQVPGPSAPPADAPPPYAPTIPTGTDKR